MRGVAQQFEPDPEAQAQAERAIARRVLRRASGPKHSSVVELFPEQAAAFSDPSDRVALLCGGRAGKTTVALKKFLAGMAARPHSQYLFAATTRPAAKNILWEPLRRLRSAHGLQMNETELRARHPNGSWLLLVGMDKKPELEKARGIPWDGVFIDECGSHKPSSLEYYVDEVIEPRTMDRGGWINLAGTPTKQAYGYFYDVTTGSPTRQAWSTHRWTAKVNPYVNFEAFKQKLFRERRWNEDNPIFRREYLGEWCVESGLLVFRFERARNVVAELPKLSRRDRWRTIMAIDYGFGDATAYAVLKEPERFGREVYVVESGKRHGLAPSEAAAWLQPVIEQHKPDVTVGDVNGIGKSYAAEQSKRYGIEVKPAKKEDKHSALEITSDALYTGMLKTLSGANDDLERQWATLLWNEDHDDIADGQDDDVAMAGTYGYRETYAYENRTTAPEEPKEPRHVLDEDELHEDDRPQPRYDEDGDL